MIDLGRWCLARTPALIALGIAAHACGGSAPPAADVSAPSQPALWYDEATFFQAVRAAELVPVPDARVAGGIIPHDWRGGRYIASFFRGIAADPPDTVVLIGPNHGNEGRAGALVSDLRWTTPFGILQPDHRQIEALLARGLVATDNSVLVTEHSVAGIMPAIAYYLPHAHVVPVILRGDFDLQHTARLAEALAAQAGGRTVFVASVDFSHDLVQSEAARNDVVTLQTVRAGDSAGLFRLDNRFLDSPPSIAVLMETMGALRAGSFELMADTNSAALHGDELAPTTSYIVGYYRSTADSAHR